MIVIWTVKKRVDGVMNGLNLQSFTSLESAEAFMDELLAEFPSYEGKLYLDARSH